MFVLRSCPEDPDVIAGVGKGRERVKFEAEGEGALILWESVSPTVGMPARLSSGPIQDDAS